MVASQKMSNIYGRLNAYSYLFIYTFGNIYNIHWYDHLNYLGLVSISFDLISKICSIQFEFYNVYDICMNEKLIFIL